MIDRVGELSVRIRTDIAGADGDALRRAGAEFARAVIERCAARLEERAPGRVVLVRTLPVRWRLVEDGLDSEIEVEAFATALADGIETQLPPPVERPSDDDDVVVFEDTAHLYADRLRARVAGETPWFHAGDDPFEALGAPDRRELAAAALARLAERGELVAVLAASPPAAVARWAQVLGDAAGAPDAASDAGPTVAPEVIERIAARVPGWRALPPSARAVALHAAARAVLGPDAPVAVAQAVMRDVRSPPARRPTAGPAAIAAARADDRRERPVDRPPLAEAPPSSGPGAAPSTDPDLAFASTQYGGLFFLVRLALELDAGQILWIACLPEGELLGAAARAILGPAAADDPAPDLFGGATGERALPGVAAEQQEEVCAALLGQLIEAFPRRDLAVLPPIAASLVDTPSGRLLLATPAGAGFPLFAWPAATPDALRAGLEQLLAAWPVGAPIAAAPALAMLAPVRLRADPRLAPPAPLVADLAGDASGLALCALVTQLAGSLCALFAARARSSARTAAELVEAHLALPAVVRLEPEAMSVAISSRHIDVGLRFAGLDADPGPVAWLGRQVRLEFVDLVLA